MTTSLRHAAERAAYEPFFLAHDFRVFTELNDMDRTGIPALLNMQSGRFDELALCRTPRRDSRFQADVRAVSKLVSSDDRALGNLLRLVDALTALTSAPTSTAAPVLAAARETVEPPARPQAKGKGLQVGWVKDAIDLLWEKPEDWTFPRDVELQLLWHLPIALVEMEDLSGVSVTAWLAARGVDLPVHSPPHSLRGALVAFAGSAVLFLDARDDPGERRMTIAHEAAHFAVDYWLPRAKLAARAPQLLDVVDGVRKPRPDDHVDALLARLPLGIHIHLFERDGRGGSPEPAVGHSEERATLVAWELLAPQAAVAERVTAGDDFGIVRVLESDFGLPRGAAREYGAFLRRAFAPRPEDRRFDWD